MSSYKTNIYKLNGKLDNYNNSICILFYIEYIMLIANIVNTIKSWLNISKIIPLAFLDNRNPFL